MQVNDGWVKVYEFNILKEHLQRSSVSYKVAGCRPATLLKPNPPYVFLKDSEKWQSETDFSRTRVLAENLSVIVSSD